MGTRAALAKERVLVVGLGEVGQPILELLEESGRFDVYGFDVDEEKMKHLSRTALPEKVSVMHVCLPCPNPNRFIEEIANYIERFSPELTIINSTVPPTTTLQLQNRCKGTLLAHSPIRGIHKNQAHMKWEIKRWTKYIGGTTPKAARLASNHFQMMGLKTKTLRGSTETELAKLFETTYRAWMISCFQEMHRIARHFKVSFDDTVDFLEDTHRVRFDRPVMFPGEIGGHCLIPNVRLLSESYNSEFLRLILRSNRRRFQEMKDCSVQAEAEKVRKRAEKLQKDLTG